MINRVSAALRRIQSDLAQVLDAEQITEVCSEVGYRFRKRILDPTTTIHLFVTQIVNGNFAVARLEEFTDKQFSEAAYCNARGRLVAGQVGGCGRAWDTCPFPPAWEASRSQSRS